MAFRIEPIHRLRALRIVDESGVVGHLFPPTERGLGEWEIWPLIECAGLIPGVPSDELYRSFPSKADALAFLGIQPEQAAA